MISIIVFIILITWFRQKQYRFVPLCILSILYNTLVYLSIKVSEIMQNNPTLFRAVEVAVLATFLAMTIFLSIKPNLRKWPICLAVAAGVCRIAHVVYSRWLNNYIRQFLGNTDRFVDVSHTGMLVSNVVLWIIQLLCLLILLCFWKKTRGGSAS